MADSVVPRPVPVLLVEFLWKQFEARIVPERVSAAQRVEMRLFFFGGAAMLFGTVNALLEELNHLEADGVLDRVAEELTAFDAELAARLVAAQAKGPMQ